LTDLDTFGRRLHSVCPGAALLPTRAAEMILIESDVWNRHIRIDHVKWLRHTPVVT